MVIRNSVLSSIASWRSSISRRPVYRRSWICEQCRQQSSLETYPTITVGGKQYRTDEWMNTPPSILAAISRQLHLQPDHPIAITRRLIESRFPNYKYHNSLFPIVSVGQNFDALHFPRDHPGRSRTDTYYINKDTVLRTHTSAHQHDIFRANESSGFLISADVYRRDAVDRSHYPVFHQMEGAMTWDSNSLGSHESLADQIWADVDKIAKHDIAVDDPNPSFHPERNPLQEAYHSPAECEAMAAHLKRSIEDIVVAIFSAARAPAGAGSDEPLKVRWVEAYFPFTSPSWELEVFWQGSWLELLGCGIIKQDILVNAGVPSRQGWAFGLGLERIAMLLFSIPDIRLFWSTDSRFLSQFSASKPIAPFSPFSKYPACPKDVAFWIRGSTSSAGGLRSQLSARDFHENDVMEIVRNEAGDMVEDVRLIDEFVHPKTGRKSLCYRIIYRSLERTLTHEEANTLHTRISEQLVDRLGVQLR